MHDLIRIATRELVAFLSTHLPTLGPQWWTTHVEDQLSYSQQQRVRDRGLTRLNQLDFAALLRDEQPDEVLSQGQAEGLETRTGR